VKLRHPTYKVGDRRDVHWTAEELGKGAFGERTTTLVFKGQITTRAVDAGGSEVEAEVLVQECTLTSWASPAPTQPLTPGTKLIYTPRKLTEQTNGVVQIENGPKWQAVKGGAYVQNAFRFYARFQALDLDAAFGTDQPQPVGGTWPARQPGVLAPPQAPKAESASGTVRLAELKRQEGAELMVVAVHASYTGPKQPLKNPTPKTAQTTIKSDLTLEIRVGGSVVPDSWLWQESRNTTEEPGGPTPISFVSTFTAAPARPTAAKKG
jgi:hypothetical protein